MVIGFIRALKSLNFPVGRLWRAKTFRMNYVNFVHHISVQREWILKVREVKVKNKSLSLFPRNEKWIKNLVHSFSRSESETKSLSLFFEKWKVKWKSSSLFSRMKSEMKMPGDRDREVKFLENSREILKFWSKRFLCRKF